MNKTIIEFEDKARLLENNKIAIWTDGLAISTEVEPHAFSVYNLEVGKKYKVILKIEEIE